MGIYNCNDIDSFLAKCKDVLYRTVPLKQKHIRTNNSPVINKNILKTVMKRTRWKNKSIKVACRGQIWKKNIFVAVLLKIALCLCIYFILTKNSLF